MLKENKYEKLSKARRESAEFDEILTNVLLPTYWIESLFQRLLIGVQLQMSSIVTGRCLLSNNHTITQPHEFTTCQFMLVKSVVVIRNVIFHS